MILAALFVVGLLAFVTEGTIGFGGTVIAASVGSELVPLVRLLPAYIPINMVLSAGILMGSARRVRWRELLTVVAPPTAIGMIAGIACTHVAPTTVVQLAFAVFVIVLATIELMRVFGAPKAASDDRPLPTARRHVLYVIGGLAHGLFGTGGPMIVYVLRRSVTDKSEFRATLAVLWLALNAALVVNYASLHLFDVATLHMGAAMALSVVPGMLIGNRLHHRLDARRFEQVVWIGLFIAGVVLAVQSALALRAH